MPGNEPNKIDRRTDLASERTDLATERNALAARRNDLAAERTELAWWRTALASLVVAFGIGRIGPELAPAGPEWPYAIVGVAFGLYAIACFIRGRRSNPLAVGRKRPTFDILLGLGALGLSLAVIALIVFL